ncbi:MAG: hypothetical protein ACE5O2_10995 [Armatimonadota bacterium]
MPEEAGRQPEGRCRPEFAAWCPGCALDVSRHQFACWAIVNLPEHSVLKPPEWRKRAAEVIATEIEALPRTQRLVMGLVHCEGLTFAESASAMDLPPQEVVRLHALASETILNALRRGGIPLEPFHLHGRADEPDEKSARSRPGASARHVEPRRAPPDWTR